MSPHTKVMLKIQNENLLPKGGGSDQPSLEHKILLHYFITGVEANVPRYILRHMVQQLRESQQKNRCWVPYGRLLSEIFHQGGIIKLLKEVDFFTDEQLGTVRGKIINAETLRSMHLIKAKDLKKLSTDLKESDAKSALMPNFPPICKQDPLDVQMNYIREHFERTKEKISLKDVPEQMYGGVLPVAKSRKTKSKALSKEEYLEEEEAQRKPSKRSRKADQVEVAAPKPKKAKSAKTESSNVPASKEVVLKKRNKEPEVQADATRREAALDAIRSKRAKGERSVQERMKEAAEQLRTKEKKPSPKKAKKAKNDKPSVMPMFIPTEEQLQYAREYCASELAKKRKMRKQFEKQRDEQLKAAGYELDPEKAAVIATPASEIVEETVKEGVKLLSQALKGKHALGATSSEPASKASEAAHPEVHSSGTSSKAKINNQIPDLPSPPSSTSSSSTESDNVPLSQHLEKFINEFKPTKLTADGRIDYEQTQIEFSKQRIEICERLNLPSDHFFQPAIPEAVSIQHPEPNQELQFFSMKQKLIRSRWSSEARFSSEAKSSPEATIDP
ncbi:hypothetical protein MTR_5g049140 [Medicago truncatula]|uniref:Uncharacterized protein n=1 Tax=Medicago truncatula TaxID=3880 RepID=A0A072UQ00_MEDTR|nr:hypothetical protein MTR_5g049140 [Medicago truncatula]